jgi:protein ImuB
LPVEALRLNADAAALLRRLGLSRIGQIMNAPRAPFAARAGQQAMLRLDQALGRTREALIPRRPPPPVYAMRQLMEPVIALSAVLTVAETLCGDLCAMLEARSAGARLLRLSLFGVDGRAREVVLGLTQPERSAPAIMRLLRERLRAAAECPARPSGRDRDHRRVRSKQRPCAGGTDCPRRQQRSRVCARGAHAARAPADQP